MARIKLAGTDISWECAGGDTIMRAAIHSGLGFPYECNVGSCGNCRFDLVEGEVTHLRADPPGLNERDRQRGRRLGCQARPSTDCTIKARLMPRYVSRFRPGRQQATLIGTEDLTHDMREFRFRLDAPTRFLPGQYALLSVPGVEGSRAYSMCNTGEDEWHFQIKRVPGGAATGGLFDRLGIGSRIGIDGPYGMAYLREEASRDVVCLAGGSGLSPMISIARAAAPMLGERRLDFVYGGRTPRDICGRAILEQLPGYGDRIRYHPAISDAGNDGEGWNGHRGFVHDVADALLGSRLPSCDVYFAGPPAMAEAVQRMLVGRGVPQDQVHFDQFY